MPALYKMLGLLWAISGYWLNLTKPAAAAPARRTKPLYPVPLFRSEPRCITACCMVLLYLHKNKDCRSSFLSSINFLLYPNYKEMKMRKLAVLMKSDNIYGILLVLLGVYTYNSRL